MNIFSWLVTIAKCCIVLSMPKETMREQLLRQMGCYVRFSLSAVCGQFVRHYRRQKLMC